MNPKIVPSDNVCCARCYNLSSSKAFCKPINIYKKLLHFQFMFCVHLQMYAKTLGTILGIRMFAKSICKPLMFTHMDPNLRHLVILDDTQRNYIN